MGLGGRHFIQQGSANWRIFVAMLNVGGLQLIVSVVAMGKDLIVAGRFGTTGEMDAFLIAFLLPSLVMNTVNGSFEVAFIPEFIRVREREGEAQARLLFSNVLAFYLVFLLLLSLILLFLSPYILPWLGSSFEAEKRALTQSLFLILISALVLSGLINACGSVLKAGERFTLSTLSPAMMHLVTVIFLVFVGGMWGVRALAIGIMAGLFLEGGFLVWGVKSNHCFSWPQWRGLDASMKRILEQYYPMIVGSLLMGSTLFVDQTMAAFIGPGSVSTLSYANKIVLFILGLGSIALSTAIFPYFSKMVAQEDWKNIRHTLKTYVRLILMVTVPLTFLLIYFSEPIVRFVFERGAFTKLDTDGVAEVQALYFLQIPFYLAGILGVRLLSALSKNQVLMAIGGINLLVNIAGNYFFMQYWGVAGISLSTSMVYLISMILIYIVLNRKLKERESLSEGRLEH